MDVRGRTFPDCESSRGDKSKIATIQQYRQIYFFGLMLRALASRCLPLAPSERQRPGLVPSPRGLAASLVFVAATRCRARLRAVPQRDPRGAGKRAVYTGPDCR